MGFERTLYDIYRVSKFHIRSLAHYVTNNVCPTIITTHNYPIDPQYGLDQKTKHSLGNEVQSRTGESWLTDK